MKNNDAEEAVRTRSLINTFVIRLLESIVSRIATSESSVFYLVAVADYAGLNLTLSKTPKTGFLATRPIGGAVQLVPIGTVQAL